MANSDLIALILPEERWEMSGVPPKMIPKPAVFFGGSYRPIDFALSNCKHSGIGVTGVITRCANRELSDYIGSGKEWLPAREGAKIATLPLEIWDGTPEFYPGTADLIWNNYDFIEWYNPENVLLLSGDHICKMDYSVMLKKHKYSGAAVTIAASNVPWEKAPQFGIINADESGTVVSFEEKPLKPKSNLASMDVYILNWETLKNHLFIRSIEFDSSMDINREIIPQMLMCGEKVAVYRFGGYWKNVGDNYSLWEANMELLSDSPGIDFQDETWNIITRSDKIMLRYKNYLSLHKHIENSLVAVGVKNKGVVVNSIVSAGVKIEKGASVVDSVIMPGAKIGKRARIAKTVIETDSIVEDNTNIFNRF